MLFQPLRKMLRNWRWRRAAARVSRPVEYFCIRYSYGSREVVGWIPRESAIECGMEVPKRFPDDPETIFPDQPRHVWIDRETSERLHRHPLWLSDQEFRRLEGEERHAEES